MVEHLLYKQEALILIFSSDPPYDPISGKRIDWEEGKQKEKSGKQ